MRLCSFVTFWRVKTSLLNGTPCLKHFKGTFSICLNTLNDVLRDITFAPNARIREKQPHLGWEKYWISGNPIGMGGLVFLFKMCLKPILKFESLAGEIFSKENLWNQFSFNHYPNLKIKMMVVDERCCHSSQNN